LLAIYPIPTHLTTTTTLDSVSTIVSRIVVPTTLTNRTLCSSRADSYAFDLERRTTTLTISVEPPAIVAAMSLIHHESGATVATADSGLPGTLLVEVLLFVMVLLLLCCCVNCCVNVGRTGRFVRSAIDDQFVARIVVRHYV
jgi:hypothetical protein